MRVIRLAILLIPAASSVFAQQWETGLLGGGNFFNHVTATAPAGNATAGFATGFAASVFIKENMQRFTHLSGEGRYDYMKSDLRLSAAGQTAQFSGYSQAIHYDLVVHTNPRESRAQFFGLAGAGIKEFSGTGTEAAFQPLSQYGFFTKTRAVKPMISVGGGFTYKLGKNVLLRAEVQDFVTPFPTAVLTPPPGVKYGGWLNDIVPMVGIVYVLRPSASPGDPASATPQGK